ncbi:MAG: class E sortase [Jatrophihabitans endophyticus]|nr:class E sortase [Jatrophihabitans endophyticus]
MIRTLLRGLGQLLLTAGVVVLLLLVYEVYVTNIFAARKQHEVAERTEHSWETRTGGRLPLPGAADPTIPLGQGIANLYIPRLGRDFHFFVVQGSSVPTESQLDEGPAHYAGTALPGRVGNFAVAGHRVGKGEPFLNLDKLQPGDPIVVETKTDWYVYRVKGRLHGLEKPDSDGIAGREIVEPSDGAVVAPVPDHPGRRPTEALMTLTTCTPKFTAAQRMVVHASLERSATVRVAATSGSAVLRMPAAISALYSSEAN